MENKKIENKKTEKAFVSITNSINRLKKAYESELQDILYSIQKDVENKFDKNISDEILNILLDYSPKKKNNKVVNDDIKLSDDDDNDTYQEVVDKSVIMYKITVGHNDDNYFTDNKEKGIIWYQKNGESISVGRMVNNKPVLDDEKINSNNIHSI